MKLVLIDFSNFISFYRILSILFFVNHILYLPIEACPKKIKPSSLGTLIEENSHDLRIGTHTLYIIYEIIIYCFVKKRPFFERKKKVGFNIFFIH